MPDKNILTCPYCESKNIREVSSVIHEPYPDKELAIYKCKDCEREFKYRGATKFNEDLENGLVDSYTIYKIGGSLSRPDIIAIKNKTALIIETKSEKESKESDCLTSSDPLGDIGEKCQAWRKYCYGLVKAEVVSWKIAIWMVHINVQALCYPMFFEKSAKDKDYYLYIQDKTDKTINKAECTRIPALAFPESYKQAVLEAIDRMGITLKDEAIIEFDSYQILIKFDSKEKMVEPAPNVGTSKS